MSQDKSKTEVKTITCPRAAVAGFTRKDGQRIWVYARTGESREDAIKRVMRRHGVEGGSYDRCS